jgi:hypothetical protein
MEKITFRKLEYHVTKKALGFKVGKLVVSPSGNNWKIYELETGRPFVPFSLVNQQDAVEVAKWLNGIYKDYLVLLQEYEPEQVIVMTQLTVPYGQVIKHISEEFDGEVITRNQIAKELNVSAG